MDTESTDLCTYASLCVHWCEAEAPKTAEIILWSIARITVNEEFSTQSAVAVLVPCILFNGYQGLFPGDKVA
jgi:hypothetical protein